MSRKPAHRADRSSFAILIVSFLACAPGASAAMVTVSATLDDATLLVGESTTLRVFAEVTDGEIDNGIFAYAMNVVADVSDVASVSLVTQLGDPAPFASDPGDILADGVHDVYGGDGGFFSDLNRGIGSPFELLTVELLATSTGVALWGGKLADSAVDLGVPDGILLQQPEAVVVDFTGAEITVVPEPATAVVLLVGCLVFAGQRGRCRPARPL